MESSAPAPSLKLDSFFLESSYPFVPHFAQFLSSARTSTTAPPTPPARPHPQTSTNCNNRLYGLVHVPSEQCSHLPAHTTPAAFRRRANSAYTDDRLSANPNIDTQHKLISAEELLEAHKLALRLLLRIADNPGTRGGDPEGETTPTAAPTKQSPIGFPIPSVPAPFPTLSFPVPQPYQHVSFDELETLTTALQDFSALVLELSMIGSVDEKSSETFSRLSMWLTQQVDPSSQPGQWRSCLQSALQTSKHMLDACKSASPHSEAPQLTGQLNIVLQRENVLLSDLRGLRAENKVTEASLKKQLEEERSARIEAEKRSAALTHRNERLHSDLQKLTSDHQAALERENLLQKTHAKVVQSLQGALSRKEEVDAHIRATRSFEKVTERRLETLQEHLIEHRQFIDVATRSLHEKANTHQSSVVELHTSVSSVVHSQQTHRDSLEALKEVQHDLSEKQQETLKRLEGQNETLSYACSRIDETRDLHKSGGQHSQALDVRFTALEQAIAELPSKEDNKVQVQALRDAIAVDLQPLAKEEALSHACSRADEILDAQRDLSNKSHSQRSQVDEISKHVSAILSHTEAVDSQLSSISISVSDVRHAQTNTDVSLASSLHLSDIGVSSEETTRALRSLEEQVHKLVDARRDDVTIKELGSIGAALVRLEHSLKNHEDYGTIGGHLKAIEHAIAVLPSKEDNKVQVQALHNAIAVDLQPLAKEDTVSYACGKADEILEVQRNNATQSQSQYTHLEEVLNNISSMVVRTKSIESQLHSVGDTIAELRRVHDIASSTHLSNVGSSSQETSRALHSLEQQIHKLVLSRHEDVAIKELGSIAAALVRLERSLKNHDSHETIGSHLETIERAIATLPSKEDNEAQAQALRNAIAIDLQPLAKEEALNDICSRADELLTVHQEVASQSQSLRTEVQELAEHLNPLLARTETINPQLHWISKVVDEIRHLECRDEHSLKPSIDLFDINVASRDTLQALEEQINKLVQLQQSDSIHQELTALATAIARVEGSLSNGGDILQSLVSVKDMSRTHQDSLQMHLERVVNQLASLSQKADTHDGCFDTIQSAIANIRKHEKANDSGALAGVAVKLEDVLQATQRGAQEGTLENIVTQLSSVAHATTQGVSRIEAVERFVKETYEKAEVKETLKEIIALHHGSQGHWKELSEGIEKVKEQVSGLDLKAGEQTSVVNGVHGVIQKLAETQLTEESLSTVTETLDHISSRCYEIAQQTRDDATALGAISTKIDAIHTLTGEARESTEVLAALKELEAQVLALDKGSATIESTEQLHKIHIALSGLSALIAAIKTDMATSNAIDGLKVDVQGVRTQTRSIIEATSDLDAVVRSSDSSSTVVDILHQKLDILSSQLDSVIVNTRDNNAGSTRLQEISATVQAIQSHATSASYEARFENLTSLSETIVQKSTALDKQITALGVKMEAETTTIKDLEESVIAKFGELQRLHPKVAELCDISNQLATREHLDGRFVEFNKSMTMLSDLASRVSLLTSVKGQTQHIADKVDNLVADMTTLVSQVEEINVTPLHTGLKDVAAQVEGSLKPTMEKMDALTQFFKSLQEKQDKVVHAIDSHTKGASVAFERIHTDSGRTLGAVKHLEELLQTTLSQDRDSVFISQLNALESQLVAMSSVVAKEEHLSALHELVVLVQHVQSQIATSTTVSEILTLCQISSEKLEVVRADMSSFKAVDPSPSGIQPEIAAFSAKLDQLATEQQTIKESVAHWKELVALYQESSQHTSAVQTQMSSISERLVALPTKADTERTLQEIIQILSRLQERDTSLLQSASRLAELVGLHGVSNEQQVTVLSQLNTLKESVSQLVAKSSETDTRVTEEVVVRLQELLSRTEVLSHTTSRLDTLVQLSQQSISHYQLLEKRVETVATQTDASTPNSSLHWEEMSAGLSSLRSDLGQFGLTQANMLSMLQNITELYEQLTKRVISTAPNGSATTQPVDNSSDFTLVVRPGTPSQQTLLNGVETCSHGHNTNKEFNIFLDRWEKQLQGMVRVQQLLEERLRPWQGHIGSGGSVESHVPVPPEPEGYSASIASPNLDAQPHSPEVHRAQTPVESKSQGAKSQTSGSPASGFSLRNRVSRAMSPPRARKFPTTTSEDSQPYSGELPDAGKSQTQEAHHHHHHGIHLPGFIRGRTLSHTDKDPRDISNPFLFFMPRHEPETANVSQSASGLLQAANIIPRQMHTSHDESVAAEKASAEKAKKMSSTGQLSGLATALMSTVSEHHQAPVLEASSSKRERVKSWIGLKKDKSPHIAAGGPSPRPTPSISGAVHGEEEHDPPPVVDSEKSKERKSGPGSEKKGAFNT